MFALPYHLESKVGPWGPTLPPASLHPHHPHPIYPQRFSAWHEIFSLPLCRKGRKTSRRALLGSRRDEFTLLRGEGAAG